MTETAYHVKTTNGHDFTPTSLLQKVSPTFQHHPGVVALNGVQDDDGQISCICGYFDDDGWTVACDRCNKWQHQLCYYPKYEDVSLPEDLQHYCVDCDEAREVDVQRARTRQRERREQQRILLNGSKLHKSHKKKIKEPGYTNGWPLDKTRHDRNSASPRDQPPPAKRPKTSHRTSDPIATSTVKGHTRKRTATNASHSRSLSRSPDTPIDLYSDEFMRCYRNDAWAVADANLHNSIAIANALSDWYNASDDEFREQHGGERGEVLMRWDQPMENIPVPPLAIIEHFDDRMQDDEGNPTMWKTVTLAAPVDDGTYIGELKGHVGFKPEYQEDAANRWSHLRHPEPFVFFHPRLPVYIDARNEGTELRYIRRSCKPNAKLQVLITNDTTYHFCFMATQEIHPGTEIAIGWDVMDRLPDQLRRGPNSVSQRDMHHLSSWVSTVLANCGPCACHPGAECLMARFDGRGEASDQYDDASSSKAPKPKKQKTGTQISPLNTNFNSRSGSEARKADVEDEQSDSRSASGSAGRGSASRDMTPSTYYSHNGSLSTAPELSERERKKLAKEEEMFRRQEEEKSGKSGKKKRNSAGSALNTPSGTSSKQLGFGGSSKYNDAGTSKQTGLPSAKPGRKPKAASAQKTPIKMISKTVQRPPPNYVDSEVQCDMDKEEAEKRAQQTPTRRPFISTTQRLLHRCALNNARRPASVTLPATSKPAPPEDIMDVDMPRAKLRYSSPRVVPIQEPVPSPESGKDVEVKDAEAGSPPIRSPEEAQPVDDSSTTMPPPPISPDVSSLTLKAPASPSWLAGSTNIPQQATGSALQNSRHPEMHLQMPPPPMNPFSNVAAPSAGAPTLNNPSDAITQSPATIGGPSWLHSPSVAAAMTPSPAKKKMSLSDYTKRSKAKDKDGEPRSERDSSPASVASGPIVPPLQTSESVRAAAEDGSAIEDDVKMEDAVLQATTVTQ